MISFVILQDNTVRESKFHNVEEIAGSTLRKFEEVHPIDSEVDATWYPLITHEVFPNFDKIIFLGADTIFNLDVGELWTYDVTKYGLVAAVDIKVSVYPLVKDGFVKHENWFNVDVLLINPNSLRENFKSILLGCKFVYENGYYFAENDALNYLFSEKYLKLPYRFNSIVTYIRSKDPKPHLLGRAIYHYAGGKPDINTDDVFNRLYLAHFLKTPWANVEMFGNIHKAVAGILDNTKEFMLNLVYVLANRQRAFVLEKNTLEVAKKIFAIKDDEIIIDTSEFADPKIFVEHMSKYRGEKILFILSANYFVIKHLLLSNQFVENQDFINGFVLLTEGFGVKNDFDSRPIVKAM